MKLHRAYVDADFGFCWALLSLISLPASAAAPSRWFREASQRVIQHVHRAELVTIPVYREADGISETLYEVHVCARLILLSTWL